MLVHLLVLDGVFDLGLAALADTLAIANELAATLEDPPPAMRLVHVGVRRRVRTAQGLGVPVRAAADEPTPDLLLLPALGDKQPEALARRLQAPDIADATALLRRRHAEGVGLGAACTASFVLAESGLLEGRAATTSWWLAPSFRKRYPGVRLDESRILVDEPGLLTAGAAMSHLDLGLGLLRARSPRLASLAARYLLADARSSQAVFAIPDHLAQADPVVERFEAWARQSLAQGFSLAEAARAVGVGERTLQRRIQSVLGKSPLSFFQDLRVERAVHLLRSGRQGIDELAEQLGYADGTTLRTLLRKRLGRGVRELRAGGW